MTDSPGMAAESAAHALYRQHGFIDCGPFGDYMPDPNSVFITLDLSEGAQSAS